MGVEVSNLYGAVSPNLHCISPSTDIRFICKIFTLTLLGVHLLCCFENAVNQAAYHCSAWLWLYWKPLNDHVEPSGTSESNTRVSILNRGIELNGMRAYLPQCHRLQKAPHDLNTRSLPLDVCCEVQEHGEKGKAR